MSDDVEVKFGAAIDGLIAGVDAAKEKIATITEPIAAITEAFSGLAEMMIAAFAVEKVMEFVEKMAELGLSTERLSQQLATGVQNIGALRLMAEASGISVESLAQSFSRLGRNIVQENEPALRAMKDLGISSEEFLKLPFNQQLEEMAEKFSGLNDGMDKNALGMALFGRNFINLLPLLNQGKEGLEEFNAMAERTGTSLNTYMVSGMTQTHEKLIEMGAAFQGAGIQVFMEFKGVIDGLVMIVTNLAESFTAAMREGGLLKDEFDLLAATIKIVVSVLATVITSFQVIWEAGSMVVKDLAAMWSGLGKLIYDTMHFNFSAAADDLKGILSAASANMDTFLKDATGSTKKYVAEMSAIWAEAQIGPPAPGHGGKDAHASPPPDTGGASAAMKEVDAEIKVLEIGLQEKKTILDQEVAQHQISQAQKFQSLQAYTDDAYEDEKELLQKELTLGGLSVENKASINAKLLELDAKYAKDSTKIQGDAIAAQQKQYQDMFNTVQGAFNAQLRGLLAGTTSWAQAFKSILGDLIIKFIEYCEKSLFEHIAAEMAKTTATVAGDTARTASNATAAAASTTLTVGTAVESIMASAAKTFAGIFGFLSPAMGPAAAGPAAAGEAVVASSAAAVYAQGTPWVPSDGMAMLHRGEAVIPAGVNAAGLGGASSGGGGDTHHHWNIQTLDGQSFARLLRDNGSMINKILSASASLNPGLRR